MEGKHSWPLTPMRQLQCISPAPDASRGQCPLPRIQKLLVFLSLSSLLPLVRFSVLPSASWGSLPSKRFNPSLVSRPSLSCLYTERGRCQPRAASTLVLTDGLGSDCSCCFLPRSHPVYRPMIILTSNRTAERIWVP